MSAERERPRRPPLLHLLAVLGVWALVFLPYLGRGGFTATEGHRVIPGWEMLETKQWFLPTMFGQVYLRKPPGMPWAVALSASVLGETEFSARLVSAVSMGGLALAAAWFGGRWFGRGHGVWAGVATALMPVLWGPGRSAEIEALNNLGAGVSVFVIIDSMVAARGGRSAARGLLLGVAVCVAALAKGPAAAPALLGAAAGSSVAMRSWRWPMVTRGVFAIAVLFAAGVLGFVATRLLDNLHASGQRAVVQAGNDFVWTGRALTLKSVGEVLAMPLSALVMSLPWGLAMLFPWGPDAEAEGSRSLEDARARAAARTVTLAALIGIALLAVAGVRNPRYAQPCIAFVPILAAYTARGFGGSFVRVRRKLARAMNGPEVAAWFAILALAYVVWGEPRSRAESGRDLGIKLGEALKRPEPHEDVPPLLLADHVVEARPEVLLYLRRTCGVRIRWVPGFLERGDWPPGAALILRKDAASGELDRLDRTGLRDRYREVASGHVHKFDIAVYRPAPARPDANP